MFYSTKVFLIVGLGLKHAAMQIAFRSAYTEKKCSKRPLDLILVIPHRHFFSSNKRPRESFKVFRDQFKKKKKKTQKFQQHSPAHSAEWKRFGVEQNERANPITWNQPLYRCCFSGEEEWQHCEPEGSSKLLSTLLPSA